MTATRFARGVSTHASSESTQRLHRADGWLAACLGSTCPIAQSITHAFMLPALGACVIQPCCLLCQTTHCTVRGRRRVAHILFRGSQHVHAHTQGALHIPTASARRVQNGECAWLWWPRMLVAHRIVSRGETLGFFFDRTGTSYPSHFIHQRVQLARIAVKNVGQSPASHVLMPCHSNTPATRFHVARCGCRMPC